jgi:beta-galactosidase/beta-glucuronidase
MESLDKVHLKDFTLIPDIDRDVLQIKLVTSEPTACLITVLDGGKVIAEAAAEGDGIEIPLKDYVCWSPDNPKLYDLEIRAGGDTVKSYFGMRKFSIMTDKKGYKRLALNNKILFHSGLLDQGYWPDGMLTPPSNDALAFDVKKMKELGFNMLRKHIKIEPLIWYSECDKQGMLVWQDMVSGGRDYNFGIIGVLPTIGIYIKDTKYNLFGRGDEEGRNEFLSEMRDTVGYLKNCVSLAMWVPFNEGWGQFDSVKVTEEIKKLDPTRTVDSVSGWHDQGKNTSDFKSLHVYFRPVRIRKDKRCLLLSEFGGYSVPTDGHMFSPDKLFGYKMIADAKTFNSAFKKLYERDVLPFVEKGLSATVYTQVSDVEEEINGIMTYDREVTKLDKTLANEINNRIYSMEF